jgi:hypothetical protein
VLVASFLWTILSLVDGRIMFDRRRVQTLDLEVLVMRRRKARREPRVLVAARVSTEERRAIERLATANDRTPSREVSRAVRYYISNFEDADRVLKGRAKEEVEP